MAITILRGLLTVAAVYHLVIGAAGLLLKARAAELARNLFGIQLEMSGALRWMLNPFAAYMMAFGLMLAITATNPVRYRPFVFVAVALFFLRVVQRVVFLTSADESLKVVVQPGHNIVHLAVVAAMGMAMGALALKLKPEHT